MRRRCSFILPVLLALLSAEPAPAAPLATSSDRAALLQARREQLEQKREQQFRAADTDHNRGLSRAELSASDLPRVLSRRFDEIDTNRDGELSPEELQALDRKRLAEASRTDAVAEATAPP